MLYLPASNIFNIQLSVVIIASFKIRGIGATMQGSNAKSFVGSSGGNAGRELDLEELDLEELVDLKDLDLVDLKDLDVDDLEKLDQGWRWHGPQNNLEPLFASLFPDPPLVSKFESCKVFLFVP